MDAAFEEASIADMTKSCLEGARQSIRRLEGNDKTYMQTRLADLRLWADSVGATAQAKESLDWRFQHRPDDIYLIRGLLFMLRGFFSECSIAAENKLDVKDIISNINSTVDSLAIVGVQIRQSGQQSRLRKADSSFDTNREKYRMFRAHLACVIASKPTENGRPANEGKEIHSVDYFANLKLTSIQERLVEANMRRRHRFLEAQRHSHGLKGTSAKASNMPLYTIAEASPSHAETRVNSTPAGNVTATMQERQTLPTNPRRNTPMTTVTSASGLDSKWGGLRDSRRPGSTVTRITSITATARYPKAYAPSEQKLIQCPCCCQAIPASEGEGSPWRKHLANDINPYTCILENCPIPYNLFATHNEWKDHFMNDHPSQWQCPCCEGDALVFKSLHGVINHIISIHSDAISDNLEDLLSDSEIKVMGITKCPLCDSEGTPDSPDLVEHVLQHIHDFSLRSLPWPMDPSFSPSKPVATFDPDYVARLYKGHEGNEYSFSIAEWAESVAPKEQDSGEISVVDSDGNELFLDMTKYENMTPGGGPSLQLRDLDRNPPKISEVESISITQFNMDYFSIHSYFKQESSDNWSSSQDRQPLSQTRNTGVLEKWACTLCHSQSGEGDENYFRHLEDTHHKEIEATKQRINTMNTDIEEWKVYLLHMAYSNEMDAISIAHSLSASSHTSSLSPMMRSSADAILENGGRYTLLSLAAEEGDAESVQRLLDQGDSPSTADPEGYTPLIRAVLNGHEGVVQLLLDKGAEINAKKNSGETPLIAAASKGYTSIVRLLLENAAHVDVTNNEGRSPIYVAASEGHLEVVKLLLQKGADSSVAGNWGYTPLDMASSSGHVEVVKLLLEKEADLSTADTGGRTPLHIASMFGHIEVVKLLLEKGADLNATENTGGTPLHIASNSGRVKVVKLLLEKGADFNIANTRGRTPLHIAFESYHIKVLELLLKNGADPNIANKNKLTRRNLSSNSGHSDIIDLLFEKWRQI